MIRAGHRIKALDFSEAKTLNNNTLISNVGTTFVPGSPEVGVIFVPPESGKVWINASGWISDDGSVNRGFMEFEVYEGTSAAGTPIIVAPNTQYRFMTSGSGPAAVSADRGRLVEGLTPGADHYARIVIAGSAGTTVDFAQRSIDVLPAH